MRILTTGQVTTDSFFFPTVEIKDYNVMIHGRNFFDQPTRNDLRT